MGLFNYLFKNLDASMVDQFDANAFKGLFDSSIALRDND